MKHEIRQAARWLREADSLLITAGAGIGIDSGLPDFRGPQGFWKAYPGLRASRTQFEDIANARAFLRSPRRAWRFYAHRLQLYRKTVPHPGFAMLLELGKRMPKGYFVFTSNVDGQFAKAGFDPLRIVECHGSIHHLQCMNNCTAPIWPNDMRDIVLDETVCELTSALPLCQRCRALVRPNILLFDDRYWQADRTDAQQARLQHWLAEAGKLVVLEIGAGSAIDTVRRKSDAQIARLIRINPSEHRVRANDAVGIAAGGLEALTLLQVCLDHP